MMKDHRQFYKGMLFAFMAGLSLDLFIVHQLIDHHHLYNGSSIDVVEPALAIVFMIIAVLIFKKEFRN